MATPSLAQDASHLTDLEYGPIPPVATQESETAHYQTKIRQIIRTNWCLALRQETIAESQNALQMKEKMDSLKAEPPDAKTSGELENNLSQLGDMIGEESRQPHLFAGQVEVQYTVNSDGLISIKAFKGTGTFLDLCLNVLVKSQPLDAFSDSMRKATGDVYSDTLIFKLLDAQDQFAAASDHVFQAKLPGAWPKPPVVGAATKTPEETTQPQQYDPNGLPVLPTLGVPTMGPANQSQQGQSVAASSLPAVAHDSHGAIGTHGSNSPEEMATDLGKYKQRVYAAIGAYWYPAVDNQFKLMPVGVVHLQFTIHEDGSVTDMNVLDGDTGDLQMLRAVSQDAVLKGAPYGPFTPVMKKEVGDSYTDDISFSTYGQ